jgi:hypothetical protein
MDRRDFLKGIFGAAALALAGPVPAKLLVLPEPEFHKTVATYVSRYFTSGGVEIFGDDKGNYSFTPMEGFRPLRAESDALGAQAIKAMFAEYA